MRYGWLGFGVSALRGGGLGITTVEENSPARAAGVQVGDVLLGIDDDRVATADAFHDRIARMLADEDVTLHLARGVVKLKAVHLAPDEIAGRIKRRLGIEVAEGRGRAALVASVIKAPSARSSEFVPATQFSR